MRFHLIDRIDEICHGRYVVAVKCVSLADDVFDEHFPGYPIFPGTLILEGLAQLGGSFFEMTMRDKGLPVKCTVLSIVREFKIRKPAHPGDRLVYRAEILSMQEDFGVAAVQATIDDEPCAEGELMFTFIDLPNEKIRESREELYGIVTRQTRFVSDEDSV
jgi:3-hydroxyacyl-[acyl-carrier-protein] dehydratase